MTDVIYVEPGGGSLAVPPGLSIADRLRQALNGSRSDGERQVTWSPAYPPVIPPLVASADEDQP